ncbi:MAG: hypothetical protein AAB432_03330 [Patescibacteria group bacterium]
MRLSKAQSRKIVRDKSLPAGRQARGGSKISNGAKIQAHDLFGTALFYLVALNLDKNN